MSTDPWEAYLNTNDERFIEELMAFLRHAESEGFDPAEIKGSFAGAMGISQFMPSNIDTLAKDGNNDGKIDLDAPVRSYLPELPELYERITVRQMVHHTSGLRDFYDLLELSGVRTADGKLHELDVLVLATGWAAGLLLVAIGLVASRRIGALRRRVRRWLLFGTKSATRIRAERQAQHSAQDGR